MKRAAKLKLTRWDAADHLNSARDIAIYLEAASEDGDAGLIALALNDAARSKGIDEVARRTGLDRDCLMAALVKETNSQLSTVLSVIEALGLQFKRRV